MSRTLVDAEGDLPKSRFEVLAEQRDYKRRRQSYRAKNVHITKRSTVEVWHTQARPSLACVQTHYIPFLGNAKSLFTLAGAHNLERATAPYSCHLFLYWISLESRLLQKPHWPIKYWTKPLIRWSVERCGRSRCVVARDVQLSSLNSSFFSPQVMRDLIETQMHVLEMQFKGEPGTTGNHSNDENVSSEDKESWDSRAEQKDYTRRESRDEEGKWETERTRRQHRDGNKRVRYYDDRDIESKRSRR